MFCTILTALAARRDLSDAQIRWIFGELMAGRCAEADAASFLTALREKSESAGEIVCAARVLREHMVRWDPGRDDLLDTCGTGGDGSGTFNISTATALVSAVASSSATWSSKASTATAPNSGTPRSR